ncbi:MAG: fused MFS/spermidine synthase [Endomicrobiales bacterium]|nr:fused MFS/spermidine synthase [Endomicrobiales bacterium]
MPNLIFFFAGFISVIIQTLFLREMLVIFCGNELSIGVILSNWLIGVASGSFIAGSSFFSKRIKPRTGLIITFLLIAANVFFSFILIRNLRYVLRLFPGEGISLGDTIWSSFVVLFSLSAFIGAQFSLGVRWIEEYETKLPAGRIYLWESLGYLAGGVCFTFIFLKFSNASTTVLILMFLCVFMAIRLIEQRRIRNIMNLVVLAASIIIPFISAKLEDITISRLYRNYEVKELVNSPYSQIVVAQKDSEKYFLSNSLPLLTFPYRDVAGIEEFGHLTLLFHSNPESVLLIGGAAKYIPAILNHSAGKIDYVEQDPWLIKTLKNNRPEGMENEFENQRLEIHYSDGRNFLKKTENKFDVILLGVSSPATLSLNRFFSVEFFKLIKNRLKDNGLFAFKLPGSLVYINDNQAKLFSLMRRTIEQVFASLKIIPGENTIFIASNDSGIAENRTVINRFLERNLKTEFISDTYIKYRLDPEKEEWLNSRLKDYTGKPYNLVNRDFAPFALLYTLSDWQSVFSPKFSKIYSLIIKYSWIFWILVFLWLLSNRIGFAGTAFTSGAAGMGLQMASIWALQVYSGNIYYWIGLLSAVFMAGLALGSGIIRKVDLGRPVFKILMNLESVFCLWIVVWWVAIKVFLVSWPLLFVFSCGSGMILGLEFPLIVSAKSRFLNVKEGAVAGGIYAADLIGGWAAGLIGSAVLMPAWGLGRTLLLFFLLKLLSFQWWYRFKKII